MAGRFAISGQLSGFADDGPIYLIMAQVFAGNAANDGVMTAAYAYRALPPGFPLLLSVLPGDVVINAHRLIVLELCAALVLLYGFYLHLCARAWHAAVLLLIFCSLPGVWLELLKIMAENQYLLLSLAILLLAKRNNNDWRRQALIGLLLAALILTRSIGITLLAAYVIRLAFSRDRQLLATRPLAALVIALLLPITTWILLRPDANVSYARDLIQLLTMDSPIAAVQTNVRNMAIGAVSGWAHHFLLFWQDNTSPNVLLVLALGLLAMVGWGLRWRELDAIYVACYGVVLMLWPYPEEADRFIYPLLPLFLLYAYLALRRLTKKWRFANAPILILFGLSLASSAPASSFLYLRYQSAYGENAILRPMLVYYRDPSLFQAIRAAKGERYYMDLFRRLDFETLCPGKVLTLKPQLFTLLSGVYAENLPKALKTSADEYRDEILKSGASCVLLTQIKDAVHPEGLSVENRLSPIGVPIREEWWTDTNERAFVLFRLRAACDGAGPPGTGSASSSARLRGMRPGSAR